MQQPSTEIQSGSGLLRGVLERIDLESRIGASLLLSSLARKSVRELFGRWMLPLGPASHSAATLIVDLTARSRSLAGRENEFQQEVK